ncbi:hypothetical protein BCR43DRAFT_501362 [Syncephalastrum racemosum]|uniref:Uncharacterized protein n=1 Tax=Syncephalastrum racemosum TaxID=13706 RepID=A0A1X2HVB2_SYNRA|nr:hypothetical protein BCR43DRAFT_501362 [Syncephalastrum racemosum]
MRIALTALLVILAHIPAGAVMKLFILFSVHIANHPGGLYDMIPSGSILPALLSATQSSVLTKPLFALPMLPESPHRVLYTPFPVCFRSSPDNDLFSNELLYWLFYPFADERLWRLLLCRLEHFHLGFFFLGSVNNIYFTYKTLNDMFDLVMLSQADEPNEFEWVRRRFGPFLKNFLLTYCCALVLLFWIHFNLYAFQVDSTDTVDFSSRRFLAELPLWTLRWITLGVAVIDFGTRRVYGWLTRIASRVDEEEVISIQVED